MYTIDYIIRQVYGIVCVAAMGEGGPEVSWTVNGNTLTHNDDVNTSKANMIMAGVRHFLGLSLIDAPNADSSQRGLPRPDLSGLDWREQLRALSLQSHTLNNGVDVRDGIISFITGEIKKVITAGPIRDLVNNDSPSAPPVYHIPPNNGRPVLYRDLQEYINGCIIRYHNQTAMPTAGLIPNIDVIARDLLHRLKVTYGFNRSSPRALVEWACTITRNYGLDVQDTYIVLAHISQHIHGTTDGRWVVVCDRGIATLQFPGLF